MAGPALSEYAVTMDMTCLEEKKSLLPAVAAQKRESLGKAFSLRYTIDEMKICRNSCTPDEIRRVLEDQVSVGEKPMRELFEIANHRYAFLSLYRALRREEEPGEAMLRGLHRLLKRNIIEGGTYREVDYQDIQGRPAPPYAKEVPAAMEGVYRFLETQEARTFAGICRVHAQITFLHPFESLNGSAARLLANYLLLREGWLPLSFPENVFGEYWDCLNHYYETGDLLRFTAFAAALEEQRLDEMLSTV